jgi:phosphatidylserine decarboxylase
MTPTPPPELPPAQTPTCAQPGGGWCVHLELAWGRVRRACLRRFFPGHVRRMAELRQGDCPNCPHDIIDPRDLKYARPACGFWFRAQDDPFAWRDRLGFARAGLTELVLLTLLAAVLTAALSTAAVLLHWALALPLVVVALAWLEVVWFFRDPERAIPDDAAALLSPADGIVTHVEEVDELDFPGCRALRISIFLSIFNVHVNRVPRISQVVRVRYFPGAFLDARNPDSARRNEQLWLDLEEPNGRLVRVKQISGAIARRIVCWLRGGDTLEAGQRFGMIKFGSRTEVLVPARDAVELRVKVGDRVHGGTTVLLVFR